ncbi:hypothetical protein RchiOBHm_CPg0502481 (chloroplast) [Rosa chinensis]|uniref:Uncharacterized protein n=1 Tax=Rosa chinensis TaxID=74649 RepID=A0A2P6P1C5_ROSCH|nr:hypothetical protein RchiOBHm_CPg0502481 [Rosa chinensis]
MSMSKGPMDKDKKWGIEAKQLLNNVFGLLKTSINCFSSVETKYFS